MSTRLHIRQPPIYAEIVFGDPSKDCRYAGICKIYIVDKLKKVQQNKCRSAFAIIQKSNHQTLELFFLDHTICDCTRQRFFSESHFEIPSEYVIPKNVAQQLNLSNQMAIPTGEYPIIVLGSHLVIRIPLISKNRHPTYKAMNFSITSN